MKKIKRALRTSIITSILSIGLTHDLLQAEVIHLSTYEREPFIGKNLPKNGYVHELVTEALRAGGYEVNIAFFPMARAKFNAKNAVVDGFLPAHNSPENRELFLLSNAFPGGEIGFLKHKSSSIPYQHTSDTPLRETLRKLEGYSLGIVRGTSIHPDFDHNTELKKQFVTNDLQNIDKLGINRLDLVLIDKNVAASQLVNHRPHLIGELEFARPPLIREDFHLAVPKTNPNAKKIIEAFNQGIKTLIDTGRYQEILASHGLYTPNQEKPGVTTLTIGTVNNGDMVVMRSLSDQFEKSHKGVKINWKVLDENTLRQRLLSDLAISEGQFDIMTIGAYEAPIWAERGWLKPLKGIPDNYQLEDVLSTVREALSVHGDLYALPFYAESSMTFYRKDLFVNADLYMPEQPTYEDIEYFAKSIHNPEEKIYGICLRGKPGWGENLAFITTVANTFGGRWFDLDWNPELQSAPWQQAITTYKRLLTHYGPPKPYENGFNENLKLFANGHCGMWIDATVAAGMLFNPKQSKVHTQLSFAPAPIAKTKKGANWLWTWALGIPKSSKKQKLAQDFILWATSQEYIKEVAKNEGWVSVPPGTRRSTYDNENYQAKAPFANFVLSAIQGADPLDSTLKPKPYTGIQFVGIHEFPSIGYQVGLVMEQILRDQISVELGLRKAQVLVEKQMTKSGYYD